MSEHVHSIYCPIWTRYTSLRVETKEFKVGGVTHQVPMAWHDSDKNFCWIGVCNSCQHPFMILNGGGTIYPQQLPPPTDKKMPDNIREDIVESKVCFSVGAYRACAVMARRAIEGTCIEKGIEKGNLEERIDKLKENGIITDEIRNWAHLVRWIGNDAAHPKKNKVTIDEANDILDFTEQIVNIIYVTPAIAKIRKELRDKKK